MKNKILFIGRFPPPIHGAANVNKQYFESKIIRKNFEVERVKINYSKNLEELGKFNFEKVFGGFKTFFKVLKKLTLFNPDLIYFEIAPTGIAFIRDSIYVLLCKLFKKKIMFQLHARGIKEKTKNKFWRNYYKFVFKNTKMILLSNLLYSEVKKVVPKNNILILNNGIEDKLDEEKFSDILNNKSKRKTKNLLFISNMVEEKGALDVLKICNELKKKKIKFVCNFVGPWQEKEFENKWKKELKNLGLKKECIYLGPKYGEEKQRIFEKTDFMIFPTKYKNESFPLVILEGFMHGIPVLSYNQGAIKKMIPKDFLGFVSEKKDWKEISNNLEKRINKRVYSKKIRKYFLKHYTSKIAENNLKKIFEEKLR